MSCANRTLTPRTGMRPIPGGEFAMGSERFYPEEAPVRRVRVAPFLMDEVPVTNAEFAAFVVDTGYVTVAEIRLDGHDYPGMPPDIAGAGSTVFDNDHAPIDMRNPATWWFFRQGAQWRYPLGPGSSIHGLDDHPVVHIACQDAETYARWAGKALPTEAEWEFAARGALEGAEYAWGNELAPGGAMLANFWQGEFPYTNHLLDGWARTSPVRSFPANGYGLYDVIGNVWEWTTDWWSLAQGVSGAPTCCTSQPGRAESDARLRSCETGIGTRIPRKVIKGGSHLCAPNYCRRYRPAARHPQEVDTGTSHIGFRCVVRGAGV